MVAFGNNVWMYYIQKLNNDEHPPNRKHLSVKYGFKCAKRPLSSFHYGYYVCEHLRPCGQYKVNREDVSQHCFMYLYFLSPFFYCISVLIIRRNVIILLLMASKKEESTMLYRSFARSCAVRSSK
jgi:hypothetical protein